MTVSPTAIPALEAQLDVRAVVWGTATLLVCATPDPARCRAMAARRDHKR